MIQRILSKALTTLIYLYFLPMIFFIPYYNWLYAKENGFINWVVFGELIPTGQGILWPYFVLNDLNKDEHIIHFNNTQEYLYKAEHIKRNAGLFIELNNKLLVQYLDLKQKALDEAKLVDIDELNNDYPNLGNHFKDYYIAGTNLEINSYKLKNDNGILESEFLLNIWKIWYKENFANINVSSKTEGPNQQIYNSFSGVRLKLSSDELSRYEIILKKAQFEHLEQSDLDDLKNLINEYTNRTNRKISKEEYKNTFGIIKISNDYMFELGISLLNTWENKGINTTNKFDSLFKIMMISRLRTLEKLSIDKACLKAAAKNQNFVELQSGDSFEFNKETILEQMKENEISKSNMIKILEVMESYVETE